MDDTTAKKSSASFGIVFDIDGVLMKNDRAIPEENGALKLLHAQSVEIPYVFATNHGGTLEAKKASILNREFQLDIKPEQMLLSHTPMRRLLPLYKDKLVVVVGQTHALCKELMEDMGYPNWIYFEDYIADRPNILPLLGKQPELSGRANEKVGAIFVLHEPHNWMNGLQLLCDVLLSDGLVSNHGYTRSEQQVVDLYVANPDFAYSGAFGQPRITAGAFLLCLSTLFLHYSGRQLKSTVYGKPGKEYHDYAESMLYKTSTNSFDNDGHIKTVYMIGDNPTSDIKGANAAGQHWYSILVRTGLFKGENDHENPAQVVVDNVYDAILHILEREQMLVN